MGRILAAGEELASPAAGMISPTIEDNCDVNAEDDRQPQEVEVRRVMKTLSLPSGLRNLLRAAPHGWKVGFAAKASQLGFRLTDRETPQKALVSAILPGPIVVSGFFSDDRGVARSAGLTAAALEAAGLPVVRHDISYLLHGAPPVRSPVRAEGGVWILHCNAPEAVHVLQQRTELSRAPMFRIGYWAWELPVAPAQWLALAPMFHEIWTPSRFCADAFAGAASMVRVMPHPVSAAPDGERAGDSDAILFTTFADLRSSEARKNPAGAIEAFIRAFPRVGQARLVVKLSGADTAPDALARLAQQASSRADIEIMVTALSQREVGALIARTDVLVSLHRSEGFGLTIAEAMAAGKAVLATDWSGNKDFMPDVSVQRVPARLTPVVDPSGLYADQCWAEPDLEYAAASLRRLAAEPALRRQCGLANRSAIASTWQPWRQNVLLAQPFAKWAAVGSTGRAPPAEGEINRP